MASTIVTALFGFLFWVVNARIFKPDQIGLATTVISATSLITQFSLLGLKNGIIRFLPKSKTKNDKINTGFNVIAIVNVSICITFLLLLPTFSTKLAFLRSNIFYSIFFVIFATSFTLNQFQEGIFVAYRSTGFVVIKNTLWGICKLLMTLAVSGFGAFGIFFAFSFGSIISFLLGDGILTSKFQYSLSPIIHFEVIKKIWRFSFGDYIGQFFAYVPQFFIPLIIINHIGASESAYYYIDQQIIGLLYIIPIATTQSLFAEGSHDDTDIKKHVKKAFSLIFLLMVPAVLATFLLGGFVLSIFGKLYVGNGLHFLQLLSIAGLCFCINSIGSTVIRIKNKIYIYALLNAFSAMLFIFCSIIFLKHQLIGIGYAYILSQSVVAGIYLFLLRKLLS